jgi:hypothetical protein
MNIADIKNTRVTLKLGFVIIGLITSSSYICSFVYGHLFDMLYEIDCDDTEEPGCNAVSAMQPAGRLLHQRSKTSTTAGAVLMASTIQCVAVQVCLKCIAFSSRCRASSTHYTRQQSKSAAGCNVQLMFAIDSARYTSMAAKSDTWLGGSPSYACHCTPNARASALWTLRAR